MGDWFREHLRRRPMWMNVLLFFCAYMALVYMPWDFLVKPAAIDEEVWFGIRFHGVWAKVLEIPHWFVYAAGMVGFWGMRPWMWPWAPLYVAQVSISMLVWPILYVSGGGGIVAGLVSAAVFAWLALTLHKAKPLFQAGPGSLRDRYGEGYAVITGASSGIGAEFARACARDGMNVVLAARRMDRLTELAEELATHNVSTGVVPCDLSTRRGVETLLGALEGLDVAVLINNAGVGYGGRFSKQDPERLDAMVQLNCAAPVALTAALLPRLIERGRGALVFTGSVAGSQPLGLHALYSATKTFDNFLAEALWAELRGSGVDCVVLQPGSTETEFQAVAEELPHTGESAEKVVRVALRALGRQPSVVSGVSNWLRANAAFRLLPRSVLSLVAKDVMEKQTPGPMR